jgi:hypothetical protein
MVISRSSPARWGGEELNEPPIFEDFPCLLLLWFQLFWASLAL